MSSEKILSSLIPELLAIRQGECLWCREGQPHPPYSMCPHKHMVPIKPRVLSSLHNTGRLPV
jgi:hypothetical protein